MAQTKIAPMPPMPKRGGRTATPQTCRCGCAGTTRGGAYIPGHDSRHKGWAQRIANGYDTTGITPGERKAAEEYIARGTGRQADEYRAAQAARKAAERKTTKTAPKAPDAPATDQTDTPQPDAAPAN